MKPKDAPEARLNWGTFLAPLLNRYTTAAKSDSEPMSMEHAILRVREKLKLTYQDVAARIGVTAGHVYWMERGKFAKVTEDHLLHMGRMAQEAGLMRTASYIFKYALPTMLGAKKQRMER